MPGSEPLLQNSVPRNGRSHAKAIVLSFMITALGCVVLRGQVGWTEARQVFSGPVTDLASVPMQSHIQGRSWQPARFISTRSWQSLPPVASNSKNGALKWMDIWKANQRPYGQIEASAGRSSPFATFASGVQVNQEDLKKMADERKASPGIPYPQFSVKAMRAITVNGANVPAGTLGTLENKLVAWDNGEYTIDAQRGGNYDYEIESVAPAADSPEAMSPEDAAKFAQEVPADVLSKAFDDLSGLDTGDLVAVYRTSGKWTYARAVDVFGSFNLPTNLRKSRSGTGKGLMIEVEVDYGQIKDFPAADWNKVKQLRQPDATRGWGLLQSAATNPLLSKIGEECSSEDLAKGSDDVSGIQAGEVVALYRSDGKFTYALVKEIIGATRTGGAGTGLLLRTDSLGEKKVMSADLAKQVKVIKDQFKK